MLNVACVCVKLSGGNCDRVILSIYECTQRARTAGLGGWGVQGLLEVFIILFSDMKRRKDGIGE